MISIAVDIGGTFTDVVAADSTSGTYYSAKVPTTPQDLVAGVRAGAVQVLAQAGADPQQVSRFIHGTTVGTNAVLERKGAKTAVLTTDGFEDVLEIGRLRRTSMYDLFIDAETPVFLAPKRRRRGIRERVAADGSVVLPLDEEQARTVVRELREREGIEAIAISFLFSFRNPAHEQRLRQLIAEVDAGLSVSLSSDVDPTFREYERTVVTAFDAYLRPVIERYIGELSVELAQTNISVPLQIMQSRGGITSAELVTAKPVSVLLSGPAAGVIGGKFVAGRSGFEDVITIDIGGTSADISLIADGKPLISTEGKIDRYPLSVPMIDLTAIGAGGGSIAWADGAGGFRVGPQSAGAEPGPACYGRGGTEATVTDASIVLGYLNPSYFAGGSVGLDPEAANSAVGALGARLGLSVLETAAGIHRVINTKMADAIRLVSIRRGYDPRLFALVCLGGAGPVHGGRLAEELSIPTLIVPPVPGVLSALGLLVASVEHDYGETIAVRIEEVNAAELEKAFGRADARVGEMMRAEQVPAGAAVSARVAEMRYVGQSYTLDVEVKGKIDVNELEGCLERFHAAHQRIYGHARPSAPVELVNVRVVQSWQLPGSNLAKAQPDSAQVEQTARDAYFEELGGFVETPVYRRSSLEPGTELIGPAIIEQMDTTVVVYPNYRATLDEADNFVLRVSGGRAS